MTTKVIDMTPTVEAKITEFPKDCPRCNNIIKAYEYMALSRRDNDTAICHSCGELEAWEDAKMAFPFAGKPYWSEEVYSNSELLTSA